MSMAAAYWQNSFAKGDADAAQVHQDAHDMVQGIQMYLKHPYARDSVPLENIFEAGTMRVLKIPGEDYSADLKPVLLVPSLINKAYIFDLIEGRSMLRFLHDAGCAPYLLDWGVPTDDYAMTSFDGLVEERLLAAVSFLNEMHDAPLHALGYCMGGTLLSAAVALRPEAFSSFVVMATPWDFHGGAAALSARVKFWSPVALPSMVDTGHMSVDWLQMLFSSLDPAVTVQKFTRFARMDQESDDAHLFVVVEDWVNDGVALPQPLAQQIIQDWFFENKTGHGGWSVCGKTIVPEEIDVPALVIASSNDKLVEFESAKALGDALPGATFFAPQCGHIGMIAGRNAVKDVWQSIADWLHTF